VLQCLAGHGNILFVFYFFRLVSKGQPKSNPRLSHLAHPCGFAPPPFSASALYRRSCIQWPPDAATNLRRPTDELSCCMQRTKAVHTQSRHGGSHVMPGCVVFTALRPPDIYCTSDIAPCECTTSANEYGAVRRLASAPPLRLMICMTAPSSTKVGLMQGHPPAAY
jgi:hypothetical protein